MSEESDTQNIERVVGDTFLCPECGVFMAPPIYQCTNGHIICNPCYSKKNHCNTCDAQKNEIQCQALEEIHSKIRFPCRYRFFGCDFMALWDAKREHEPQCPNKPPRSPRPNPQT